MIIDMSKSSKCKWCRDVIGRPEELSLKELRELCDAHVVEYDPVTCCWIPSYPTEWTEY